MITKARTLPADEVVLDLEDAVAPNEKTTALATVLAELESWSGPRPSVRVNAPGTAWCHAELIALAGLSRRPLTVVVPKVESPGDLAFVDRLLDGAELAAGSHTPIRVLALIETPAGLTATSEIAAASERLDGLILGYADLGAALGRTTAGTNNLGLWLAAQETVLTAARTNNIQAIDGPFLGIANDEPFMAAATRAQELGFDGKWAIHPSQLDTLMRLFTPSEAELAHAHAVIEALDGAAAESGSGAVALDGQMLDEALRRSAIRTIARSGASL